MTSICYAAWTLRHFVLVGIKLLFLRVLEKARQCKVPFMWRERDTASESRFSFTVIPVGDI